MKKSFKNSLPVFAAMLLFATFVSCEKDSLINADNITEDTQLIEAIQNAQNKSAVLISELPSSTLDFLAIDYSESYAELALIAPNLGYEISVRRNKGSQVGMLTQIYFNVQGSVLSADRFGGRAMELTKGKDGHECFDFVYPISFTMPDSSVLTVSAEDELRSSIKAWYDVNIASVEKPSINFPIDVIIDDATTQTIINMDELIALRALCGNSNHEFRGNNDGEYRASCFKLIYPVTHIMPDGSLVIVEDSTGMEAIKAWYLANPDSVTRPTLVYPVEVLFADGTTQTVSNSDEMLLLKSLCKEYRQEQQGCFNFVYPITHIMPDGTEIVVDDVTDRDAIIAWYAANPDSNEKPSLVFPLAVIYEDGATLSVENEEALIALRQECQTKNGKGKGTNRGEGNNGKGNGGHGQGKGGTN